MDYEKTIEELKKYYADLLIFQYQKPKAIATIKANIEMLLSNLLILRMRDECMNVDVSVGVHLDIIGKWVGVDRYFKGQRFDNKEWLAYYNWDEDNEPNSLQGGYYDWNSSTAPTAPYITYGYIMSTNNKLDDDDFRLLIKLKIIKNNTTMTAKNIDDNIHKIFGDLVYTVWGEVGFNKLDFVYIGSPIDTNGVLSGFSAENYAKTVSTVDFTKQWEITTDFIITGHDKEGYLWGVTGADWYNYIYIPTTLHSLMFSIKLSDESTKSLPTNYQMEQNVEYIYTVGWTGTQYYVKLYSKDKTLLREVSLESTLPLSDNNKTIQIGYGSSGGYDFAGVIDLKGFKIINDNVEIAKGEQDLPMILSYYYNPSKYAIIELAKEKNVLPCPTGVQLKLKEQKND